jgi:hypothetical protein
VLDVVSYANGPAVQILDDLTADGEKAILVVEGRVVKRGSGK